MTSFTLIATPAEVEHDPAGEDIQLTEDGDELIMSFSEELIKKLDLRPGDRVIFNVDESLAMSISFPDSDLRRSQQEVEPPALSVDDVADKA